MTHDSSSAELNLRHEGRGLLLSLYAALRSLKLYPLENTTVQKALDDLLAAGQQLLGAEEEVEIRVSGDFLFVNDVRLRLELDNYASFSQVLGLLRTFEIGTFRILRGVERREWQALLSVFLSLGTREAGGSRFEELMARLQRADIRHMELEPLSATEEPEDSAEAREVAKRTYAQSVAVTKDVVNSIRMGRTANLKKVKRAVQLVVDQVLNNETSIVGLTTIRDYDEYTFTHSVNVCIFSVALGKKLGFAKLQLYDLGLAALLHDIGKARIPIDVLNKSTGLDETEWTLMQRHPWFGTLTLFSSRRYEETPYRAILVAHEHHMKADLTGYPRPIRARQLGLYSRLVAVADGFDAATTRRSYQTIPIQPDEVLKEMWQNPRRGYDRVLVKALINLIGIYPVGTCVILDTLEVAVVAGPNPDPTVLNRPLVRIVIDVNGAVLPAPGLPADLAEGDGQGGYARSIVKVTDPARYGLVVGDCFV
jgi:HD-GYP domain-containing protein (c-di-GMP phosphodiesterase class II)